MLRKPSSTVGCSLKLRLGEEGYIASTPKELRALARAVLRHGRARKLLAFRCEANQLRIVIAGEEEQARELDRRLKIQLRSLLLPDLRFGQTWLDVLTDQDGLFRAFKSVVQSSAWTERLDPYHEGSNLPDLLGLRSVGRFTIATVKTKLPEIQRAYLLTRLGITNLGAQGLPQAWHTLGECALSVVAASDLRRRSRELAATKHAAVQVVSPVLRSEAIGALLQIKPRTVRALRADTHVDEHLHRAITLQLQMRARITPAAPKHGT